MVERISHVLVPGTFDPITFGHIDVVRRALRICPKAVSYTHLDQILVLDDGHVVGQGTHEELLRTCDAYREIAVSQLSSKELGIEEGEVR